MWASLILFLLMSVGFLLMFVILLQRGRGGGLAGAFGGMGGQSAFGTKAGDVFTKITVGLATVWVVLAGASGFVLRAEAESRYRPDPSKAAPENPEVKKSPEAEDPEAPKAPVAPAKPEAEKPEGSTPATEKPEDGAAGDTKPDAAKPADTKPKGEPEEGAAKPPADKPADAPAKPADEGDAKPDAAKPTDKQDP